ncbi:GntR family transcriptional regulator, partial [Clavibacter michiganensis]|uniref:GntR family transcriptional regulator n=1 Tax=Clavibacter michiganensis TaxID=28447 RepID=UPI0012DDDD9F
MTGRARRTSSAPGSPFEDRVRAGKLPANQRLPTVRQLAADLQVAPGTVGKAYALLESEGLLVTNRSKGTR